MRLRRTALPSAFLMLQPNRLRLRPLRRRKMVNSRLDRRIPSRYTASYSQRRTNRDARGKPSGCDLHACETVAPLLAALRKNLAPALAFHACAKPMLLVARAHMWLESAFRQRSFSSTTWAGLYSGCHALAGTQCLGRWALPAPNNAQSARIADPSEEVSLVERRSTVKEGLWNSLGSFS